MPFPHLILPRFTFEAPRRKTGFGFSPPKEFKKHGEALKEQVDEFLLAVSEKPKVAGFDPALILRVHLNPKSMIQEGDWEKSGLMLLSVDRDKTFILFCSDLDLTDFKTRLEKYKSGPIKKTSGETPKSAPYNQIFASIEEISSVSPEDKIGRLFNQQGITKLAQFQPGVDYVVDVQLWDFGSKDLNKKKLAEVKKFFLDKKGQVTDDSVEKGLVLIRVKCKGALISETLKLIDSIAVVDLPPQPSLTICKQLERSLKDFRPVQAPPERASSIAVLDSGLMTAHPLLAPAVGESTSLPAKLNSDDKHGHGTMVCGLALYGDVESCIDAGTFAPSLKLYSAKVLNDDCKFDDEKLIVSQMRDAITYFRSKYGCRVFNLSLGDERTPYKGGKVSAWASILDNLCRELDIIIVVSAGNYFYNPANPSEHHTKYPKYLLDTDARIIEPATGAIVLTVGALAKTANVPVGSSGRMVTLRPIAQPNEPSPFTRSGPGLGDSIKPELCEYGGNSAYDGLTSTRNDSLEEMAIISTNNQYLKRLFKTDIGTSYAAPRIAHAAARLFSNYPSGSANLIRAFLAASASLPEASEKLLSGLGENVPFQLCGYGRPDVQYAALSSLNKLMLYSDTKIKYDHFHLYHVPIPEEFFNTRGRKTITVTLAFDPPVRHTRFDYLGVTMSFRLIRGKDPKAIVEAFRQRTKKEAKVDGLTSTRFNCPFHPTPTIREGGTLQKGIFSTKQQFKPEYGQNYFLVVRCEKRWARKDEKDEQRYAVAVTLEHQDEIDLYTAIKQRVDVLVRVRARPRA